ncbi:MAG: sulfur carrier protein ThiS [Candidatus Methanomethylophilaceae archaeon]
MGTEMVRVNGRETPLSTTNAAEFVSSLGYDMQRIAVELNGDICPRSSLESTVLRDGDSLEIVSFVGGG